MLNSTGTLIQTTAIRQAISYCGLWGDEQKSADKTVRTPLSKERNKQDAPRPGRKPTISARLTQRVVTMTTAATADQRHALYATDNFAALQPQSHVLN
jgi:hypothetical protein